MELFLSHASRDSEIVSQVQAQVEALAVRLYLAEHDNQAGNRLSAKVEEALERCDALIVLLTRAGYDSRYVQQEIGFAKGRGKLVIPLLDPSLAGCDLGLLNGIEYILFDTASPADGLARLGERIDSLVRQRKANQEMVALVAVVALVAFALYASR